MNGRVNDGAKAVHAAGLQWGDDYPFPLCSAGGRYKLTAPTEERVTCKRCRRMLRNEGKP